MATLELIEESLVWLYNKHKENHSDMGDISQFVKSLGLPATNEVAGENSTNQKYAQDRCPAYTNTGLFTVSVSYNQGTPTETMALSLKVLAHLKTSKNEYFNLENIPALNQLDWNQIGELTKYLLKKNFIKIKGIDSKIFGQITQLGLQFSHACEATAC